MDKKDWSQLAWLAQQFAAAQTSEEEVTAIGMTPDGPILPAHTVSGKAVADEWLNWVLVGQKNNEPVCMFVKDAGEGKRSVCMTYCDSSSMPYLGTIIRPRVNVIVTVPDNELGFNQVHYIGHDHHRPYYWWQTTGPNGFRDERSLVIYENPVLVGNRLRAFFLNDEGHVICDEVVWERDREVNRVFAFDPATEKQIELYRGYAGDCYDTIVQSKLGILGLRAGMRVSGSGTIHVIEGGERRPHHIEAFDRIAFNVVQHPYEKVMMLTQLGDVVRQHYEYGNPGGMFLLPRRYRLGNIYATIDHGNRQFIEVKRPHNKVGVVVCKTELQLQNPMDEDLLPGAFDAITAPFKERDGWYYFAQSGRFLLKLKIPPAV